MTKLSRRVRPLVVVVADARDVEVAHVRADGLLLVVVVLRGRPRPVVDQGLARQEERALLAELALLEHPGRREDLLPDERARSVEEEREARRGRLAHLGEGVFYLLALVERERHVEDELVDALRRHRRAVLLQHGLAVLDGRVARHAQHLELRQGAYEVREVYHRPVISLGVLPPEEDRDGLGRVRRSALHELERRHVRQLERAVEAARVAERRLVLRERGLLRRERCLLRRREVGQGHFGDRCVVDERSHGSFV
mmetsp:Transcript_23815/g.71623  ORF Transcript_23815/g.71623 Transcript_23815/m.71623 type:complete len:255 (+) Transcript_23815:3-767(+)